MPQNQYIPGTCNIGAAENAKRKRTGWLGLLITIAIFALLAYSGAPRIWRLLTFVPAALSATGFLQARMHFCAYFGLRGLFNFGAAGKEETVEQKEFRRQDRKKAVLIILYSIIVGLAAAVLAYYI